MAFDNERLAFQAYSNLAQLLVKVIFVQAGDGREIGDIDSVKLKRLSRSGCVRSQNETFRSLAHHESMKT